MSGTISARFGTRMWRGLEKQISSLGRITYASEWLGRDDVVWGPVAMTRCVESGTTVRSAQGGAAGLVGALAR